jgi:phage/plasmid primase-like uncharacterized protein
MPPPGSSRQADDPIDRTTHAHDPIHDFLDAITEAGLPSPDEIVPDGKLHRFSTNGRRDDRAGWYVFYLDGVPAGAYGDHRTGLKNTWSAKQQEHMTSTERAEHGTRLEMKKRRRKQKHALRHAEVVKKVNTTLEAAKAAGGDHPYLKNKGVRPPANLLEIPIENLRQLIGYAPRSNGEALKGRILLVSVEIEGKVSTLEMIDEAGRKSALCGGKKAGGCWAPEPLPKSPDCLYIAEGAATIMTVCEATGGAGVAALSCGNLAAVARAMTMRFPKAEICILADLGNGEPKARQAAEEVGGMVLVPDFGADRPSNATDFNDLSALFGLDAVARAIEGAEEIPETTPERRTKKRRLLIENCDPDRAVEALRDILSEAGGLYDRGMPVRLASDQTQGGTVVQVMTPDALVLWIHQVCRPYVLKKRKEGTIEVDARLPRNLAVMYLDWRGEWRLPALNGIASAPLLGNDGRIHSAQGYDRASGMWCENVPDLAAFVPERPTREHAAAALLLIRKTFKTFCFGDAETVPYTACSVDAVDISKQPFQGGSTARFLASE